MKSLRRALNRMLTKPVRSRPTKARLAVEALERRQLLASLALNSAGVLTNGPSAVDTNVAQAGSDAAGDIFELKYNSNLWKLAAAGAWTLVDNNVGSFSVDAAGQIEDLKTNGMLWGFDGSAWHLGPVDISPEKLPKKRGLAIGGANRLC